MGETDLWIIKLALHDLTTASSASDNTGDAVDFHVSYQDGTVLWAVTNGLDIVDALELYDANGRCVRSSRPRSDHGLWRPEGLAPGGYVVRALLRSGHRAARAVVLY